LASYLVIEIMLCTKSVDFILILEFIIN
jgi:hypothetical protein